MHHNTDNQEENCVDLETSESEDRFDATEVLRNGLGEVEGPRRPVRDKFPPDSYGEWVAFADIQLDICEPATYTEALRGP